MIQQSELELIRPKSLAVDHETLTQTYGRFTVEPLEKGYGVTLGNSLRRILLSSLPGAAIITARIEGMQHEFSSLSHVREDGSDIVLNLKQVKLKLQEGSRRTVSVQKKGPCQILARDIQAQGVLVLNPDHPICTVADGGTFRAELTIATGRGYMPSKEFGDDDDKPVGTLALDALFSPIQRVNYNVTNARVGRRTDYDKLLLEIWTDGSLSPQTALESAARIHRDYLSVFATADTKEEIYLPELQDKQALTGKHLLRPVEELDLSVRSAHCLANAGVRLVGDLVQRTENEMMKTKNFGRKSLKEIKEALSQMGLSLGLQLPPSAWPPKEEDLEQINRKTENGAPAKKA
ncbi:MAG: DNA-directed RNA polymerase subunit alpha [Myxococcota bacterium]